MNSTPESRDSIAHNESVAAGATPADWSHWQAIGLTADLLPVVSDLSVPLSPTSTLTKLDGKTPTQITGSGEAVGVARWSERVTTPRDIERWSSDGRHGIGVIGRQIKAVDIDIDDPVLAGALRDSIDIAFGPFPCRSRSNTGRCLLVFRMAESMAKTVIKVAAGGAVEFLGDRQQFLLNGTHKSGVRYEWLDGLPAAIPEMTGADIAGLIESIAKRHGVAGGVSTDRASIALQRPRKASDVADPDVAWLFEKGWVLDEHSDGKLDVRCPWEDEHTSDTGPSATTYMPAGLGGEAHAGFKCLHAHCTKRDIFDFRRASGMDDCADEFEMVTLSAGEPEPLPTLERDKLGRAEASKNNLVAALSSADAIGGAVAFDRFTGDLMLSQGGTWRKFAKTDYTALAVRLESAPARFKNIQKEMLRDIVELLAAENVFDSAQQWIDGLRWDGVPRVDTFCERYFGAEATPYARAVSRYLWSGFAARVIEPGAKCDMLVTLVGTQGAVKTTAVEALTPLPEAFGEIDLTRMDDNLTRKLRGKLVCEIAELKGLRSRDADSIKAWLSRRFEEHVEKWDTFTTRTPRRCMFIGTTNDAEFLDDETGERRHLPLQVTGGGVAAIERDRDQLWAEGAVLFRKHGVLWKDALELARAEHAEFKVTDPWHDRIAAYTAESIGNVVRVPDLLEKGVGLVAASHTKAHEMRAGRVLTALGYRRGRKRIGGVSTRYWEKS